MRVLVAPDWRKGNSYQQLLATALEQIGIKSEFLSEYRRILPLARGIQKHPCDLIHLHWPEAYFDPRQDGLDWFRKARFRFDLSLGTRSLPLVMTAHNLLPHDLAGDRWVHANIGATINRASRVIVHSEPAISKLGETFGVPREKCRIIPHGDLSVELGPPVPASEAIEMLGLSAPVCLMFGMIKPYKGIETMIDFWKEHQPQIPLAIIGKPEFPAYGEALKLRASGAANILTKFEFLGNEHLRLWLSAAGCVLFNFEAIFNSGAASLARSYGIPILLPNKVTTLDLDEPNPRVLRFSGENLFSHLKKACEMHPDYLGAAPFREKRSWQKIAKATAEVYQESLSNRSRRVTS